MEASDFRPDCFDRMVAARRRETLTQPPTSSSPTMTCGNARKLFHLLGEQMNMNEGANTDEGGKNEY